MSDEDDGGVEQIDGQNPVIEAEGRSEVTIVEILDDENVVGSGFIDLHEQDWTTTHVSLEKLYLALEAAASEGATHTRFHVNENGVVVVQDGYGEGVVVMPTSAAYESDEEVSADV